jgi:hypothetical protein
VDATTRAEVNRLNEALHDWAVGDIKKTAAAGVPVGAFILGAHFIDTIARLASTKRKGRPAWEEFVPKYLPRYTGYAYALYSGFRGATSHHYSADGIRFVDKEINRLRHWTEEEGERVLHLEAFIEDIEQACTRFFSDLESDEALRAGVLARARARAPLGVRGGEPVRAAVEVMPGYSLTLTGYNPTHFGPLMASGASWPELYDKPEPDETSNT